ncbi:MAG: endolytic transglycosylase MltG [Deltaproteobacteria bacterium]|nr:endolytic transglycosylase MltG [Deltaproteobacteria bacterium]
MRRLLATFLLVSLITVGVLGFSFVLFIHLPYGQGGDFTIEPGKTVAQITDDLERHSLISSKRLFKLYVRVKGLDRKIRAGDYKYPPLMTPKALLGYLLKGDFARVRITIVEGWTAKQIAKYLADRELLSAESFLAAMRDPLLIQSLGLSTAVLEGYLYPDTYQIYRPKGPEEVVRKLVNRFHEVYYKESFVERAREVGMSDYDVLVLSSIVEKETGRVEERPLIASVFLNRLKKGIALASDPTVIYGLPNFDGNLRKIDLETASPYNTYLNPGLPPTPISNPGRDSLRAVLYPAESDYLYFVAKGDGSHEFSRTLEEHNKAVYQYQQAPYRN